MASEREMDVNLMGALSGESRVLVQLDGVECEVMQQSEQNSVFLRFENAEDSVGDQKQDVAGADVIGPLGKMRQSSTLSVDDADGFAFGDVDAQELQASTPSVDASRSAGSDHGAEHTEVLLQSDAPRANRRRQRTPKTVEMMRNYISFFKNSN